MGFRSSQGRVKAYALKQRLKLLRGQRVEIKRGTLEVDTPDSRQCEDGREHRTDNK